MVKLVPGEPGSSPLVRGGLCELPAQLQDGGLIPARAGRTRGRRAGRAESGAHPRSCGADPGDIDDIDDMWGSSPLVRGGPMVSMVAISAPRLIPARAGRTGCVFSLFRCSWAHPRSCGADPTSPTTARICGGSSPLVRGGRHPPERLVLDRRLIPARAGRTRSTTSSQSTCRAHPRSCGADVGKTLMGLDLQGSSPLVRGGRRG